MDPTPTTRTSFFTPKSIGIFLVGIILVTLLIVGTLSLSRSSSNDDLDPNQKDELSKKEGNLSPHTLVYGSWNEESTSIMAYDLTSGDAGIIAKLPLSVKKVSVLSPSQLLFISEIDVKDHGQNIVTYDLNSKETTIIYSASDGFVIDDYVLSQNKQYLAVWEIQPHLSSGILLGGKSRVYTAQITSPNRKNSIYQEDALVSNPVRYPRGILNNGTVFMDRFLPNYVAGWGYGMSVSNFLGTEKQDITDMQNGTYSTQPVLSDDGKFLVFSGYDGSKGDGSTLLDGFKRAQLFANTVETVDTTTLKREKLTGITSSHVYPYVTWDGSGAVVYYQSSNTVSQNGLYHYNLSNNKSDKLPTDVARFFVQSLSTNSVLIGNKHTSTGSIGNLGPTYESPYTDLMISDKINNTATPLSLDTNLIQYIDTLPANYFADSTYSSPNPKIASPNGNNIQIGTFIFKPQIEKEREDEQQDPVAPPPPEEPDPVKPKTGINKPNPTQAPPDEPGEETIDCQAMARNICKQQHPNDIDARGWCIQDLKPQLKESGQCNASPLYLYGSEGKNVTVTIHTPIYNADPAQSGTLSLITHSDGTVTMGANRYESFKFDYISAVRRTPHPKNGWVTSRAALSDSLTTIAKNLALNVKETRDLVAYGKSVATGDYIFVSFFDHETSHAILPITFDPQPNVYRNMVFYFKNFDHKPNYSVQPPIFDPIRRYGFTAIEISGYVE